MCRHEAIAAFGDCEVTGLLIEGGRAVGVQTARGTIRAEHVVIAARDLGARGGAAGAGAQRAARAGRAPARLHGAAARARGGDARGRAPDPAPPGPRDVLPPGRPTPTRSATTATSRAWPIPSARPSWPSPPTTSPRRRAEAGRMLPALRDIGDHARLQRADVVHARRLPAAGRERRGARTVAGAGDLGHALGRLRARAGRAHDPRRRAARPPRVRPAALRRARHEHELRARCAARRATARSTTSCTRASRTSRRAGCARRRSTSARSARRGLLRERRVGAPAVVRGQPQAADRRGGAARTTSGRRASGRRSCRPSTARAASGWGSSTSRRSPRSRSRGPARSPSCSAWPPTTSTSPPASSSTRRCSRRAAGSCAT